VKKGLRVIRTYRIGRNLLPVGGGCCGNHRGRRKEEGDCPLAGVAGRGNHRGKKKREGGLESP
jgi:hypothetical protein